MKIAFYIILILISICVAGCMMNNYESQKTFSPSGKYYIITTVNQTDKSKNDYADVYISLFSNDGVLKNKFNSKAGDFNKWAIGWDSDGDTIIMNSSDIGMRAWRLENDQPIQIEITEKIKSRAKILKAEKYK